MSYVPPHRRNPAAVSPIAPTSPGVEQSLDHLAVDVHSHLKVNTTTNGHTLRGWSDNEPSAPVEGELKLIVIFPGSQPRYTKNTFPSSQVFTHTHLGLLGNALYKEVPVFQIPAGSSDRLVFDRRVLIERIEYHDAHSEGLVQLLKAKFGSKNRDEEAWAKSLRMKWAQIWLKPLPDRLDHPMSGYERKVQVEGES